MASAALVGQDLDVGRPRMIIHRDVQVRPADAARAVPALPGNPVVQRCKPPDFPGVRMQQVPGLERSCHPRAVRTQLRGHEGGPIRRASVRG